MVSEWSHRDAEIEDVDKQVAATLTAALIARGFNLPAASNTAMVAIQAVGLYRQVLDRLKIPEPGTTDAGTG